MTTRTKPQVEYSVPPKKKEKTICTWKYNLSEIGKSSSSIRLSKMDECKQLTTLGSGMTRSSSLCETMIQEVWTTLTEKYENQWLNQGFVQHIMVIMVIIIIFCHHDHLHVPSQFQSTPVWIVVLVTSIYGFSTLLGIRSKIDPRNWSHGMNHAQFTLIYHVPHILSALQVSQKV